MQSFAEKIANLQRLHDNLKFADAKAGALLVPATAMCVYIHQMPLQLKFDSERTCPCLSFDQFLLSLSFLSAAASIVFCFAVIRPRGKYNRDLGEGLIDASRIYQFGSSKSFADALNQSEVSELHKQFDQLAFCYSLNDSIKYRHVRAAFWFLAIAGVALFFHSFISFFQSS